MKCLQTDLTHVGHYKEKEVSQAVFSLLPDWIQCDPPLHAPATMPSSLPNICPQTEIEEQPSLSPSLHPSFPPLEAAQSVPDHSKQERIPTGGHSEEFSHYLLLLLVFGLASVASSGSSVPRRDGRDLVQWHAHPSL